MTLCWETAYKWASLSKQRAAWCLNRNSTVDGVIITVTFCIITVCSPWIWGRVMTAFMNQWANEAAIVLVYWNTLRGIGDFCSISALWVLRCHITGLPHSESAIFLSTSLTCQLCKTLRGVRKRERGAGEKGEQSKKERKVTPSSHSLPQ